MWKVIHSCEEVYKSGEHLGIWVTHVPKDNRRKQFSVLDMFVVVMELSQVCESKNIKIQLDTFFKMSPPAKGAFIIYFTLGAGQFSCAEKNHSTSLLT